jgi:UDP-N-acetylglucosamine 1-carboxyvinyltransferase
LDKLYIEGGIPLKGKIRISGAKNAALPLMATSLLTDQPVILENIPKLSDIQTLGGVLTSLGVSVFLSEGPDANKLILKSDHLDNVHADYDLVRKMRASILVLGPLVARHGKAEVSLPGGCALGTRPVDLHIKGLEKMGAKIALEDGYIRATAPKGGLKGAEIAFPLISVTGTENLMMAATLARGTTRLINAAREPEVVDLAHCLNQMGAKISGAGTDTVTIEGVSTLKGTTYSVVPDRIETGTYIVAAGITNGEIELTHTSLDLLPTFVSLAEEAGLHFNRTKEGFIVSRQKNIKRIKSVDMITEPYPGFPTDLQAQFMALMTVAEGSSTITETIFENRFMHVAELLRMGADIQIHGSSAIVKGKKELVGAPVMATDLRASACLVLAGLAAKGHTTVNRIYHLDRGYEAMEKKLQACGAKIERIL